MAQQAPDIPDPLVGTLVSERYRILRKLGEGGMGRVYEAQHELIGKRVALKCLNAEFATHPIVVERFKREARAATAVGSGAGPPRPAAVPACWRGVGWPTRGPRTSLHTAQRTRAKKR